MGLFDIFKKNKKSPQIDPYVQERCRILSVLADQAMQFPDSRVAVPVAFFLKNTTEFESDYASARDIYCCCENCAPYRNRCYSLSGKDKRFPKLPDFFLDIKNWEHCHVVLQPIADVIIEVTEIKKINEYNRPFVDDRTPKEKQNYLNHLAEKQAEAEKIQDKEDYQQLSALYPDIVPKSFSAYRRLRNSDPEKFQKLRQKLEE